METNAASLPRPLVGCPAPEFILPSTKDMTTLEEPVRLADYWDKWLVLLFYPQDFTFVCPTELRAFNERFDDFVREGVEILGVSTDSVYSHRAWIMAPRELGGLGPLRYVLASDSTHQVSKSYGVLLPERGHTLRATFLIDPKGMLRSALINDLDVGRSVDETLRTIQAFNAGGLCPADWRPGQETIQTAQTTASQ
jgi:peroxiredoxin (alkyl hydroperoxide reductase subunit C)